MENGVSVVISLIIMIAVLIMVDYFIFYMYRSSRDNYKWLRRESELLNALVKDYQGFAESVKEINQRANQVWDLIPGSAGITLPLSETHVTWLNNAKVVAEDAAHIVQQYKTQMPRGDFSRSRRTALFNLLWTWWLTCRVKRYRSLISDHLDHANASLPSICKALEASSRSVSCLKDRPIDESTNAGSAFLSVHIFDENFYNLCQVHGMEKQMKSIEAQTCIEHAFMEDLQGVRLESKIGNAWLREVQQLVAERNEVVHSFVMTWGVEEVRWFSVLRVRRYRRELVENIKHAYKMLFDLLDAKERYGFKLVGIESKFPHPNSLERIAFDATVSSVRERVYPLLREMQEMVGEPVNNQVMEVLYQLKVTQDLMEEMQVPGEGTYKTQIACFKELRKISSEAEASCLGIIELGPYFLPYLSSKYLKFSREIDAIEKAASLLQKKIREYRIEMVKDSSSVVGLEEDIHALVLKLTASEDASVICIVGMKGIGKTTLVKEIRNHTSITNHFQERGFFVLSQESQENESIISSIVKKVETWERSQERDRRHHLLVLENLFPKETWDKLEPSLSRGLIRVKVVITTRDIQAASYVKADITHQIRLRTKEESWELFTQMVPMSCKMVETEVADEEKTPTKKKQDMVRKMVRRAGGLPLAILHIGYLLARTKMEDVSEERLSRVLEHVTRGQNQYPWDVLWKMNKEDFNSQQILGKCLSSFEIIPFNFEIPARRVVANWVAQGLANSEDASTTPEMVADKYLSDLINRNMIQVVERKLNGKVKTCRFPATLRELWLQRPLDSGSIRAWSIAMSQGGQLAYHFDDSDANHNHRIHGLRGSLIHEERHPRTIMFFDTREGRQPGDDIGEFLHKEIRNGKFQGLLMLDLEGIFRPRLPKNIGKLKQLAYLGLRWTYLEKLPSSIGNLLSLQTLDIKYTYIRTLPDSVWKLKKLRHLYLNEHCRITMVPKPSTMPLGDLHSLSGAYLDEHSPLKGGLDKLGSLRKLGLVFDLDEENQEALVELIMRLTELRSLSLSCVNEKSQPQPLHWQALSSLEHLSSLYLFGNLVKPSITENQLPKSLTELILSASGLEDDPMSILGKLQYLKSLSFLAKSYKGTEMVCSSNAFPELLDLKLWSLDTLKSLSVDQTAMPNLREMEIRSCTSFEVSRGLTHLKTLQELKLTDMPKSYVQFVLIEFTTAINQSQTKIHSPKIKIEE